MVLLDHLYARPVLARAQRGRRVQGSHCAAEERALVAGGHVDGGWLGDVGGVDIRVREVGLHTVFVYLLGACIVMVRHHARHGLRHGPAGRVLVALAHRQLGRILVLLLVMVVAHVLLRVGVLHVRSINHENLNNGGLIINIIYID